MIHHKQLVYYEPFEDIMTTIEREKQLKAGSRKKNLIKMKILIRNGRIYMKHYCKATILESRHCEKEWERRRSNCKVKEKIISRLLQKKPHPDRGNSFA